MSKEAIAALKNLDFLCLHDTVLVVAKKERILHIEQNVHSHTFLLVVLLDKVKYYYNIWPGALAVEFESSKQPCSLISPFTLAV